MGSCGRCGAVYADFVDFCFVDGEVLTPAPVRHRKGCTLAPLWLPIPGDAMSEETETIEGRTKHPTLRAALHAVMCEVGYVEKTGQAPRAAGGFKYASDGDLIRAVRPAMLKHGLVGPLPVGVKEAHDSVEPEKKMCFRTTLVMIYEFHHVDSDEVLKIETAGQGADNQDKAAYKAMTGAFKYALRESLMIETGDDPERDGDGRGPSSNGSHDGPTPDQAAQNGRAWVVRQLLAKAIEGFAGGAYSRALQDAGCPPYEQVKFFCLWKGWDKPSIVPKDKARWLIEFLQSPEGRREWQQFEEAVGLNNGGR